MKKIKIALTIVLLTINIISSAQLNPIKDLYWHHWYSMPYNFYELSWSKPDTSLTDTLVGYNIYRDNILYRFQTSIGAYHTFPQDTSFGGEAFVSTYGGPFYIHVSAVYNSNHIESIYNDSALCYGAAMGQIEFEKDNVVSFPNPVNNNSIIQVNFTDGKTRYISIFNSSGQLINKTFPVSNEGFINVCDLNLKNDLYFFIIYGDNYYVTKKFIKVE